MTDRIFEVYTGMLTVGEEVLKLIEKGKGDKIE